MLQLGAVPVRAQVYTRGRGPRLAGRRARDPAPPRA